MFRCNSCSYLSYTKCNVKKHTKIAHNRVATEDELQKVDTVPSLHQIPQENNNLFTDSTKAVKFIEEFNRIMQACLNDIIQNNPELPELLLKDEDFSKSFTKQLLSEIFEIFDRALEDKKKLIYRLIELNKFYL